MESNEKAKLIVYMCNKLCYHAKRPCNYIRIKIANNEKHVTKSVNVSFYLKEKSTSIDYDKDACQELLHEGIKRSSLRVSCYSATIININRIDLQSKNNI